MNDMQADLERLATLVRSAGDSARLLLSESASAAERRAVLARPVQFEDIALQLLAQMQAGDADGRRVVSASLLPGEAELF